MSGTTVHAGTPLTSLPNPTATAATDMLFMLVVGTDGVAVPAMVPRSVVLKSAAALGANGDLLLSGLSALLINEDGHYVFPATIPDTNDGFVPVAGSRVLYTDGGVPKFAV